MVSLRFTLSALLLAPAVAAAQPAAARRAAETITESEVRRRIEIIAHDSMGGRDTPSRGLDLTAAWVAAEFARIGLKPAGGEFVQRYAINVTEADPDSTFIEFNHPAGARFKLRFGHEVFLQGRPTGQLTRFPMVILGGPIDSTALRPHAIDGRLVVWITDWEGAPPRPMRSYFGLLNRLGAAGLMVVTRGDPAPATGPGLSPSVRLGPPRVEAAPSSGGPFLAMVTDGTITSRLPEAAEQFAALRTSPSMVVQPSDWVADVIARMAPAREMGAPNVAGILEGSDPALRQEYIVISAHMDHVGSRCRGVSAADAICNGADDDASGTVGVVELAEALAQPGARPRRSVLFLTVSAEERGLWGSRIFASDPPVDIKSIVANFNMDMIGRNWPDTIVAIGKSHSDLGPTVDEVAAAHPDLGMKVVDDLWPEENLYGRSDHFNFARRGVPVLFFTSGLHDDYHAVTDSPEKIDAEKEARILRLVFHLTREIGNRAARPKWKKESYDAVVGR